MNPSKLPSMNPSKLPSMNPSKLPSKNPSKLPSMLPSMDPSKLPSMNPSKLPSRDPSKLPSALPSNIPTIDCADDPSYEWVPFKNLKVYNCKKTSKQDAAAIIKLCNKSWYYPTYNDNTTGTLLAISDICNGACNLACSS